MAVDGPVTACSRLGAEIGGAMHRTRTFWLLSTMLIVATMLVSRPALARDPEELEIGFVPSIEAGALEQDIQPLADYLSDALGMPVRGKVASSYPALVTALQIGRTHIGALPPLGMVQAIDVAGAEVVLQSMRFGSPTYHSQFFTNAPDKYCTDEPVVNERREAGEMLPFLNCNGTDRPFDGVPVGPIGLDALRKIERGTTVAFTRAASSSGYIFPATVLANQGIDPKTDLYAIFAGEHDRSVITVCTGEAEIGVSYDDARPDAITDCDVAGTVVVFAYGPEIPNDGIAVSGDLSDGLRDRIKQALLDFAATEEGAAVLDTIYNINAFTDPDLDTLQIIRDAVEKLGYGQ
jgi:phosphonate transport system substrate-binding protein